MIEIALATDAHYLCGLLVTAVSLALHASPDADLRFNVLDGGISDNAWADFEAKVRAAHPRSFFRRLSVDDTRFAAYPEWNGRSRLTYARLLLPTLMPDTDWVIYCDVDFLWCADVAELWALRDSRATLLSTPDGAETCTREAAWFAARGLTCNSNTYFCAGLSFFNLALWRHFGLAEKVLTFLDEHTDVLIVDQSAMNAILGGEALAPDVLNVKMLPGKWQKMSRFVTAEDIRGGCVIHYAGDTPWRQACRTQPLTDLHLLWHMVYGELQAESASASLARFFPSKVVRLRRFLFYLIATPVLREFVSLVYRLTGRSGYVAWMKGCCRRFPVDEMLIRFLRRTSTSAGDMNQ